MNNYYSTFRRGLRLYGDTKEDAEQLENALLQFTGGLLSTDEVIVADPEDTANTMQEGSVRNE